MCLVRLGNLLRTLMNYFLSSCGRPSGVVVRKAGCCTKGLWFESRVRHGCQTVRPWPHQYLHSKTGTREVPDPFLGRACRPSRSDFSVVFLRNSIQYGLRSFRKTTTESTPPIVSGPTSGQLDSNLQPTYLHAEKSLEFGFINFVWFTLISEILRIQLIILNNFERTHKLQFNESKVALHCIRVHLH